MTFYDYILEDLQLDINRDFGNALLQVYSPEYLSKIKEKLKKNIKIKEKNFRDPSKAAYTEGKTIYINKPVFETLSKKERTKYFMHEFVHIMQNTKNFFIFKTFKEVYNLGKVLYGIVKENVKGDISEFLTGSKQKIGNPKLEIISYLMNGDINWNKISKLGRQQFIEALQKSNIFNLKSSFWKERL